MPPASNEERESEGTGEAMTAVAGDTLEAEPSAVVEAEPAEIDEALSGLGQAVDREAGAYDLSEEGHKSAIETAERAATEWAFNPSQLVYDLRDMMVDQIKRRPKPWSASSPAEQRDVFSACEFAAQEAVRKVAEAVAARGQEPVRVLLDKVALGDKIQITGTVKTFSEDEEDAAVMLLHHARGKHVMLTVASKDDYQQGDREADVEPEEPPLPFEAGDDSDLAAEHLEPTAGLDHLAEDERVNLQTGMIERKARDDWPEEDERNWDDVREATAAELAAERERTADFADA